MYLKIKQTYYPNLRKIILGILSGSLGTRHMTKASAPQQFADVIDVGINRCFGATVAVVGDEHALSHAALDVNVDRQEHDAVQVERLGL